MEDVSDAVFRKLCREHGAGLCVTEFVNAEGLLLGCRTAAQHRAAFRLQNISTGPSSRAVTCLDSEVVKKPQIRDRALKSGLWKQMDTIASGLSFRFLHKL